jgi:hypothetical protein
MQHGTSQAGQKEAAGWLALLRRLLHGPGYRSLLAEREELRRRQALRRAGVAR